MEEKEVGLSVLGYFRVNRVLTEVEVVDPVVIVYEHRRTEREQRKKLHLYEVERNLDVDLGGEHN